MDAAVKKQKYPDRLTLRPTALVKLSHWATQINNSSPGTNVTRADLVHWLIETYSDDLSASDLKTMQEKFYDCVKHAKWVLKEANEAKAAGQTINIKITNSEGKISKQEVGAPFKKKSLIKQPNNKTVQHSETSVSLKSQYQNLEKKDETQWLAGK